MNQSIMLGLKYKSVKIEELVGLRMFSLDALSLTQTSVSTVHVIVLSFIQL